MKTVAIELRLTSLNRQRSHCQRLIRLLLGDEDDEQAQGRACCRLASACVRGREASMQIRDVTADSFDRIMRPRSSQKNVPWSEIH